MIFTKYLYISFWFNFIVNYRRFSTHTTGWKRVSLMYLLKPRWSHHLQIVQIKNVVGQNKYFNVGRRTSYPHYMLKMCFAYVCIHTKYYISNILGYFNKNQDLFTLPELMDSPHLAHHINFLCYAALRFARLCSVLFCVAVFCFVWFFSVCIFFLFFVCFIFCLSFFLFPQCGQGLFILYSSLRFQIFLTFVHL
jgi:hypothetical protein